VFYTKTAKVISVILLFMGIMRVFMGVIVASSEDPVTNAALYLGNSNSGEAVNEGLLVFFVSIVLGVLTEMSTNLNNKV